MGVHAPIFKSSYRTYEEWKLETLSQTVQEVQSSYRTYEEWKRFRTETFLSRVVSSYRTYEEWKHLSALFTEVQAAIVLTVPMRNGNESQK